MSECDSCGNSEPCGCKNPKPDAVDGFAGLWENINGRGSWYENPWVVAYTFEKPEQVADE